MTFQKYNLWSPFEIIFTACASVLSWSGLQRDGDKELLKEGAQQLIANVKELMRSLHEDASVPTDEAVDVARLTITL